MSQRAHRLLIPLAALIPILPLLLHGPSCGHDFDFHILSWLEVAQQLLHAHYPQWAYTPAFNAGEPRFLFYPPVSWMTGATLGLVLPWHFVPIVFTWLALTLSGLTLHRLASRFTTPTAATLAAAFYLANPYMLFTAYERTAYGELLAAAWIPLLLAAMLAPRVKVVAVAVSVALLWLTNAPAAVMSCYALALLALIRLVQSPKNQFRASLARNAIGGVLLGLTLAAFYILPAVINQPLVQTAMAVIPGMAIADNTLFHHTTDADHDVVLHTASLLAVLLLTLTVAALIRVPRHLQIPLAILTGVIAFLLTPPSLFVWHHAPELIFLQFPWRFLAIIASILAFSIALTLRDLMPKPIPLALSSLALVTAMSFTAFRVFNQPCDTPDTVEARVALFHSPAGTEPTDEYTPAIADNDSLHKNDPPYWLSTNPDALPPTDAVAGALPNRITVNAPIAETLILNRRRFPLWIVMLNGHLATLDPPDTREDGLITLPVPAGLNSIDLRLHRTRDEDLGLGLSVASLVTLLYVRRKSARPTPSKVLHFPDGRS